MTRIRILCIFHKFSNTYKIIALAAVSGGFPKIGTETGYLQRKGRPLKRLLLFDGLTLVVLKFRL